MTEIPEINFKKHFVNNSQINTKKSKFSTVLIFNVIQMLF